MPTPTTTPPTAAVPEALNGGGVWYRPSGDKLMEPFMPPIVAAEHKIRNLEKRKVKLDQYRTEQEEGKTLNADQLAAVAKYGEVIQQLEQNREIISCLRQVHQQTSKLIKQELKRENAERNKFILSMLAGLDQLQNPKVQKDFLAGELGALKGTEEDVKDLTKVFELVRPSLREEAFPGNIEVGAEVVSKLFESRGQVNNKPSHQLKTMIEAIVNERKYFTSTPVPVVETIEEVKPQPKEVSKPAHQKKPKVLPTSVITNPVPAPILMKQDSEVAYSFIQESQLNIESPRVNTGVVTVLSKASPPLEVQSIKKPENSHVITTASAESLANHQSGVRDSNIISGVGDEVNEWVGKSTTFTNKAAANGNMEGGDENNKRNSRRGRGRSRGGYVSREQGESNEYERTGGGGGRGGYYNGGGARDTYRDRIGQSDAETVDYRRNGRGNGRNYRSERIGYSDAEAAEYRGKGGGRDNYRTERTGNSDAEAAEFRGKGGGRDYRAERTGHSDAEAADFRGKGGGRDYRGERSGHSDAEFRGKSGRGYPRSYKENGVSHSAGGGPPQHRGGHGGAKIFNGNNRNQPFSNE